MIILFDNLSFTSYEGGKYLGSYPTGVHPDNVSFVTEWDPPHPDGVVSAIHLRAHPAMTVLVRMTVEEVVNKLNGTSLS